MLNFFFLNPSSCRFFVFDTSVEFHHPDVLEFLMISLLHGPSGSGLVKPAALFELEQV